MLSCKKSGDADQETPNTTFAKVVILGNSLTYSEKNPAIGWNGSWGMAASAPEKDYVHLLTAKLKVISSNTQVQYTNISGFELNYNTYDFDQNLKSFKDSQPDLLILRIGENVQSSFNATVFAQRYQDLINYMKAGNPNLKVLAVGSFWPNRDYINTIMEKHSAYISLANLGNDLSNYAFDMPNVDASVQGHPGDKGMAAIADAIYKAVIKL